MAGVAAAAAQPLRDRIQDVPLSARLRRDALMGASLHPVIQIGGSVPRTALTAELLRECAVAGRANRAAELGAGRHSRLNFAGRIARP